MFSRLSQTPYHPLARPLAIGTILLAAGCNITGSWRVAEIKPDGAPFPFQQVLFDRTGKFMTHGFVSAKGEHTNDLQTLHGRYVRQGAGIRMTMDQGANLLYKTRRRLNGELVMTLRLPNSDRRITAILVPADITSPSRE